MTENLNEAGFHIELSVIFQVAPESFVHLNLCLLEAWEGVHGHLQVGSKSIQVSRVQLLER